MPTGYTHGVSEGKIETLKDFAWTCARGMGALISMRDDPMNAAVPEQFQPDTTYHDTALASARELLKTVPALSVKECDAMAKSDFEDAMASHLKYTRNRNESRERYQNMICKVEAWKPDDEVLSLKEFMLSQLRESMEFDCPRNPSYKPEPPVRLTAEQWREKTLEKASRDVAYHTEKRDDEIARVASRNKWLAALRASLK